MLAATLGACATASGGSRDASESRSEDRVLRIERRDEVTSQYEVSVERGKPAGAQSLLRIHLARVLRRVPMERQTVDRTVVHPKPPPSSWQEWGYAYGIAGTVVCSAIFTGLYLTRSDGVTQSASQGLQVATLAGLWATCPGAFVLADTAKKDIETHESRDHLGTMIISRPLGEAVVERTPAAKMRLEVRAAPEADPECARAASFEAETNADGSTELQVPSLCAAQYEVWVREERAATVAASD
jgi:hypothetical protein